MQLVPGLPPHRHQYGQHSSIKLRESSRGQAKFVITLGKPKNRAITDTSLELSFIQKYLPTAIERQTTGNAYAVMAGVMYVSSPKLLQVSIFRHDLSWLRPRHPFLAPAARIT
ncbi:hypothetical protein E0E53_07315 [Azotobacter chroococcum]|nr:hypothetical protein E0E53_07315 [Azotobacter chroococcum]